MKRILAILLLTVLLVPSLVQADLAYVLTIYGARGGAGIFDTLEDAQRISQTLENEYCGFHYPLDWYERSGRTIAYGPCSRSYYVIKLEDVGNRPPPRPSPGDPPPSR